RVSLDASIPLLPWTAWIYYAYFPALAFILLVSRLDRRPLYEAAIGFLTCHAVSLMFFLVLPSRILPPDLGGCPTVSCRLLEAISATDDGFNIFPSLHVANTVMVWLFLRRYLPSISLPYGILVSAIVISTLTTHRHVIADLPAGAALGVLGYVLG